MRRVGTAAARRTPRGVAAGLVLVALALVSCSAQAAAPRPERSLSTYAPDWTLQVVSRIAAMPAAVEANLTAMAPGAGFRSYLPDAQETALFQQYYDLLPDAYRQLMAGKLARIYFVDRFDSGGMTDTVFDDHGQLFLVLYLNRSLLTQSLTDWIAFRDQASFAPSPGVEIASTCSGPYRGLIHTLLHEASHMYDYYQHVTPFVERWQKTAASVPTPFVRDAWADIDRSRAEVLGASHFTGYGLGGKIDASLAPELYMRLSVSPFASLYGAQTWAEDFAESFAWWYLNAKLGVSYIVTVRSGNDSVVFAPFTHASARVRIPILTAIAP